MAEWDRKTPWRQGLFLSSEAIDKLNLRLNDCPEKTIAIMASHDCDLPHSPDIEPYFEVVVGRYVDQLDGRYTHTKNPRKLHIQIETADQVRSGEFMITNKLFIQKEYLPDIVPNLDIRLCVNEINVFRRWLSIRYARSSFPDAFEARLKTYKLDKKITQSLKKHGNFITGIFFDVDNGEEITRTAPEEVYTLDIILLYSTQTDPTCAEAAATEAKTEITELFRTTLLDTTGNTWREIELRHCDVLSDEALSYRQSTSLQQWRIEYISLAEDPPDPIIQ